MIQDLGNVLLGGKKDLQFRGHIQPFLGQGEVIRLKKGPVGLVYVTRIGGIREFA